MKQFRSLPCLSTLSLFSLGFFSVAHAQDSISDSPKSSVVVGFEESISLMNEVNPSFGTAELTLYPSTQSSLYVGYNRSIGKRFDVEVDGGIALQFCAYTIKDSPQQWFPNPQVHVRAMGAMDLFSFRRERLSLLLGAGVNRSLGGNFSSTYTVLESGPSGSNVTSFSQVVGSFEKNQFYSALGFRLAQGLKNQDELIFSLKGIVGLKPIIHGNYALNSYSSEGEFSVKNVQFQVGVAYHFTGSAIANASKKLNGSEILTPEGKKRARVEKRYYDPKSWFVELSGGYFWMLTQEEGNADVFENVYLNKGQWQLSAEKGIGKNIYLEGSIQHQSYAVYARTNNSKFATFLTSTTSNGISLGLGKRFISSSNFNWLNIEAGISLNVSTRNEGQISSSIGTMQNSPTGDTLWSYNTQSFVKHTFFSTIYLGANKEFQLTKRFYLTLAYQYNLGLSKFLYSDIQYTAQNQPVVNTQLQVKGTSHSLKIGVKFRI